MPRFVLQRLALLLAAALVMAVGGCSGAADILEGRDQAFTKPIFQVPDWAKTSRGKTASLWPTGAVGPEDLVDASGQCPPETARAQAPAEAAPSAKASELATVSATPTGPPAYGSVAGDLASSPMPQGRQPAPMPAAAKPSDRLDTLQPEGPSAGQLKGGIALGMTECQAVRRAGQPSSVAISSADKGTRKVVVTYIAGPWPGIYTFDSGRLKEVDAAPEQVKPAKPAAKKKPKKKAAPKTATTGRVYVQ